MKPPPTPPSKPTLVLKPVAKYLTISGTSYLTTIESIEHLLALTSKDTALPRTMRTPAVPVTLPKADHPVALVVVVLVVVVPEDADAEEAASEEEEDEVVPPNAEHTPMPTRGLPSQRKRTAMFTGVRIAITKPGKLMIKLILLLESLPRHIAFLFHTMINSKNTTSKYSSLPRLAIPRALSRNRRQQ